MRPAPLSQFFPLDDHTISQFLRRKGARLVTDSLVVIREHLCTATLVVGWVKGDHGAYTCQLLPTMDPWMGWCPGGGVHDLLPPGQACSHPLALAAKWAVHAGLWQPEASLVFDRATRLGGAA